MRVTVAAVLAAIFLAAPAVVSAHDSGSWEHKNHYLRSKMIELGASPGCDLVADECEGTRLTGENVREYFGVMRRAIAPPPSPPPSQPTEYYGDPIQGSSSGGGAGGDLASIRACESGGDYSTNTGNGYYGAYQFDQATWQAAGGSGNPAAASPAEQDRVAANWIAQGNRGAWPNC